MKLKLTLLLIIIPLISLNIFPSAKALTYQEILQGRDNPSETSSGFSVGQVLGASTTGLVGYWKFDEGSGTTAADSSGSNNTGTLTNSPTWTTGKVNGALSFDGINDNVNLGRMSSTENASQLTWSFWAYSNAIQSDDAFLSKESVYNAGSWHIGMTTACNGGNQLIVYIAASAGDGGNFGCADAGSVATGRWVHYAVVFNGTLAGNNNRLKIYVDGVQDPVLDFLGTIPASTIASAENVRVGSDSSSGSNVNAKIDEVRIYNRALSAPEVLQLYNLGGDKINSAQTSRLTNGLVGFWPFNGGDVTDKVYDRSGQNNNGGFYGGATSTAKTIGKLGQALKFDGVDDRIDISTDSISTGTVTVCAWIHPTILDQTKAIVSNARFHFAMYNANNTLYLTSNLNVSDGIIANSNSISLNTWQYVCGVRNSGANGPATIYVNGVSVGSGNSNTPTAGFGLAIGDDAFTEYPWKGSMDEIRIYNRALSVDEIKQLYNMGR